MSKRIYDTEKDLLVTNLFFSGNACVWHLNTIFRDLSVPVTG